MFKSIDWKGGVMRNDIRKMLLIPDDSKAYRIDGQLYVPVVQRLGLVDSFLNQYLKLEIKQDVVLVGLVDANEELECKTTQTYTVGVTYERQGRITLENLETSVSGFDKRRLMTCQEFMMVRDASPEGFVGM